MTDKISYTIRRLEKPSDAEIESTVAVLTTIYLADYGPRVLFGPRAVEANQLINRSQVLSGFLAGEVYVAENDAGNIVGIAVWFGPGRDIYDSEDQRATQKPLFEFINPEVLEVMQKMSELRESSLGKGTTSSQWLLQRIGVLPEYEGNGIATALINEVRRKTDGFSIVLQTILLSNVDYYRYLGFRLVGYQKIPAPYGDIEPFVMRWSPTE